jgi:hypothetical protein
MKYLIMMMLVVVAGCSTNGLSEGSFHAERAENAGQPAVFLAYVDRMFGHVPTRTIKLYSNGAATQNHYGEVIHYRVEPARITELTAQLQRRGFFSFTPELVNEELDSIWRDLNPSYPGLPRQPVIVVDGRIVTLEFAYNGMSNRVVWTNLPAYLQEWPASTNLAGLQECISLVELHLGADHQAEGKKGR